MLTHLALFRQRALIVALIAFVIVLVLWNVPAFAPLLYPVRLFVTFVHETGHGLAAMISGGQFNEFRINPNGSGLALTTGGSRVLILPAGYLGAALFGAILFYVANRVPFPRTISLILAILIVLVTLLYTSWFSTAWVVGVGMAIFLLALWRFADRGINLLVLNVLALLTALNAVLDLVGLVTNVNASAGAIRNDAAAFSNEIAPLIPPVLWAVLWAITAVLMVLASAYFAFIRRR